MTSSIQRVENDLLLQAMQNKTSLDQTQSLSRIAPHVLAAIHAHNNQMLGAASQSGVGAGAPVGDDPFNPFNGGGYVDQLAIDIENVYQNPNDPTAVAALVNYLAQLSQTGQINDPNVQSMLAQFNMASYAPTMINELVFYSYFMDGGKSGAQALITQLMSAFGNGSQDSTIAAIQNELSYMNSTGLNFYNQQFNPSGDNKTFIFVIPNPAGSGTITLNWNDPSDQFAILQAIGNEPGPNGGNAYINGLQPDPASWLKNFLSQYRKSAMADIWNKSHNLGLLIMYLMMLYDGDSQSQQGGLANTTNLLSDLTNKYANQLLTLAQSIGNGTMTSNQVAQFVHLLLTSTSVVGWESQMSGMSSDWTNNVLNPILNVQVTLPTDPNNPTTLGNLISAYTSNPTQANLDTLTTGFNTLTATSYGPAPGFQALTNALQSGSGLLTGMSKTVSTQLSLVTNLETQLIKLGNSNATSNGGGWMQMINAILNNQVSH